MKYNHPVYLVTYVDAYFRDKVTYVSDVCYSSTLEEAYEHNENCRCDGCYQNGYSKTDVKVRTFYFQKTDVKVHSVFVR